LFPFPLHFPFCKLLLVNGHANNNFLPQFLEESIEETSFVNIPFICIPHLKRTYFDRKQQGVRKLGLSQMFLAQFVILKNTGIFSS
jgi:hypothetical protein